MSNVTLEVLRKLPADAMVSYGAWKRQFLAEHPEFLTEVKGLDWYLIDLWAFQVRINEGVKTSLRFERQQSPSSMQPSGKLATIQTWPQVCRHLRPRSTPNRRRTPNER